MEKFSTFVVNAEKSLKNINPYNVKQMNWDKTPPWL